MLLVRIRRGAESMLSNVFLTVKSVCGVPVTIVTKHISGSIRWENCSISFELEVKNNFILGGLKFEFGDLIPKLRSQTKIVLHPQLGAACRTIQSGISVCI